MKIRFDENGRVTGYVNDECDMEDAETWFGEIPEGFNAETYLFYRLENGILTFDETLAAEASQKEAAQIELSEIAGWFSWYDNQVQQYLRAQRLGEMFDGDIVALDAQAKEYQIRIRALKQE